MDKIKTLSAAMRYGAKLAPQCAGAIMETNGATCAIGSAVHAVFAARGKEMFPMTTCMAGGILREFGLMKGLPSHAEHPMDPPMNPPYRTWPLPLTSIIANLNDVHHWTREQIADWLDTLPKER